MVYFGCESQKTFQLTTCVLVTMSMLSLFRAGVALNLILWFKKTLTLPYPELFNTKDE